MCRWLRTNMQTSSLLLYRCCHITIHLWNQQPQYASGKKHGSQRADLLVQSVHLAFQPVLQSRPSIGTNHLWREQLKELGHPSGWAWDGTCCLLLYQSHLSDVSKQGAVFVSAMELLIHVSAGFRPNPFLGTMQRELKGYFFVEPKAELPCSRRQHRDSGKCVWTDRTLLSKPGWLLAQASNAACEDLTPDNLMDTVWVLEAREAKKMKYLSVSCSVSWDI